MQLYHVSSFRHPPCRYCGNSGTDHLSPSVTTPGRNILTECKRFPYGMRPNTHGDSSHANAHLYRPSTSQHHTLNCVSTIDTIPHSLRSTAVFKQHGSRKASIQARGQSPSLNKLDLVRGADQAAGHVDSVLTGHHPTIYQRTSLDVSSQQLLRRQRRAAPK